MKKLLFVGILILCSCSRHDDLPPALDVLEPPVPTNLTVETTDYITFQLSWQVDDPSVVSYYRVYSRFEFSSPALEDTTRFTSVQVSSPIPVPGVIFCVSAVTIENVEGLLECKAAE
jgi:hypothetical protein